MKFKTPVIFGLGTLATLLSTTSALATANVPAVISERVANVRVEISNTNVKLSSAGYSMPYVKVLIPDLADITLLDHRNFPESAPCMATAETNLPSDVIKGNPAHEIAPVKITLTRTVSVNPQTQLCDVILTENLDTRIRGILFVHERSQTIATRSIEDCR